MLGWMAKGFLYPCLLSVGITGEHQAFSMSSGDTTSSYRAYSATTTIDTPCFIDIHGRLAFKWSEKKKEGSEGRGKWEGGTGRGGCRGRLQPGCKINK